MAEASPLRADCNNVSTLLGMYALRKSSDGLGGFVPDEDDNDVANDPAGGGIGSERRFRRRSQGGRLQTLVHAIPAIVSDHETSLRGLGAGPVAGRVEAYAAGVHPTLAYLWYNIINTLKID